MTDCKLIKCREIFYFLSVAIIVFFVLEFFFPGMVLAYFNVNILLFFWIIDLLFILIKKNN